MAMATITATPRAMPKNVNAVRSRWRVTWRQEIVVSKRSIRDPSNVEYQSKAMRTLIANTLLRISLNAAVTQINPSIGVTGSLFAVGNEDDRTSVVLVDLLKQLKDR